MPSSKPYRLVKLVSGVHSVHSTAHDETFHPVIGPVAEAEALYVRQLRLLERLRSHRDEFVVWDVGLGAAANAVTVVRAAGTTPCRLHLISFDHTLEPLEFALEHSRDLGYLAGFEEHLRHLMEARGTSFASGKATVEWELRPGDFPSMIEGWSRQAGPRGNAAPPPPHAILFDAYSPATNPAMWTGPLFANLYQLLDPSRPCALPTYSRSTMLRVSLLLAGFYVGAGHATGEKEETTIAVNTPALIQEPLGQRWLRRARNSTSAEPLWEPTYRQAPLSRASMEKLLRHPQFADNENRGPAGA